MISTMLNLSLFLLSYVGDYNATLDSNRHGDLFAISMNRNGSIENHYYSELSSPVVTETQSYNPSSNINSSSIANPSPDRYGRIHLLDGQYTMYPYQCIVKVIAGHDTNGDGVEDETSTGTGVIVGPRTVLSCAHAILWNHGWPTSLAIEVGSHRPGFSYIRYTARYTEWDCLTVGNFWETESANDDWSLLDLDRDIGSLYGYLGVASDLISEGSQVRLHGYYSDLNGNMAYADGPVSSLSDYKFSCICSGGAGTSGGPITYGTDTVVGVVSSGLANLTNACRVSPYIVEWIGERL